MVEVIQAAKDGKQIEVLGNEGWEIVDNPIFDFSFCWYRIKPEEATRKELTEKWVKDNNIVFGSKVKVVKKVVIDSIFWFNKEMDECVGKIYSFIKTYDNGKSIQLDTGENKWCFPIESLEPYTEEYVPFTFEDRELFRDKWVKWIDSDTEFKPVSIGKTTIKFNNEIYNYKELIETLQFIDGTPFGKLKQ